MTLDKTVRRGMNNLAVSRITDLADIVDKKSEKTCGLSLVEGRRQWVDVILSNRLLVNL